MITGGAFMEPSTLQFFYDLGIPVANGYGLTEAGTALTLNDLKPFRADTVGKPLPGVELRVLNPDAEGIGEVAVQSKTVMSHYLDDPELTAQTIVDGWLLTGDLGRFDGSGHLQLFGRKKNMIVTEGGKNIYPEDIETVFDGIAGEGILRLCGELYVAAKRAGPRDAGAGVAAGAESAVRQRVAGGDRRAQPAAARLQARGRISDLGERFSANGVDEDQAQATGRRDRQNRAAPRVVRWWNCECGGIFSCRRESGGGRRACRKLVGPALDRLRAGGIAIRRGRDAARPAMPRDGPRGLRRGRRKFIAVGGDGTSYEIVNGLFPAATAGERPTLGFLPLGTGNSFLRDFSDRGVEHAIEALLAGRSQACDVLRLRHRRASPLHQSAELGFAADVATLRRAVSAGGENSVIIVHFLTSGALSAGGLFLCASKGSGVRPSALPVSHFQQQQVHRRHHDDRAQGRGERRLDRIRALGTDRANGADSQSARRSMTARTFSIRWPSARPAKQVEFQLDAPVDVMVDGEVLTLQCEELDVLPGSAERGCVSP